LKKIDADRHIAKNIEQAQSLLTGATTSLPEDLKIHAESDFERLQLLSLRQRRCAMPCCQISAQCCFKPHNSKSVCRGVIVKKNFERSLIFLTLVTQLLLASLAFATGGRTGNGGDWRRISFTAAQREASNWVNSTALNPEVLNQIQDVQSDSLVKSFVYYPNALQELAIDIVTTQHIYIGDDSQSPYTTCAWTNDPLSTKLSDVTLTLRFCEGGLLQGGQAFANRVLIHESVHHLLRLATFQELVKDKFTGSPAERDAQEEAFCDKIALVIQQAFELIIRQNKPHWRDMALPLFDATDLKNANALEARGFHASAWTGQTNDTRTSHRMIIWGGCQEGTSTIYACGGDSYFNDGAIYDPSSDSWKKIANKNAPRARAEPLAIWTANKGMPQFINKMILWGGCHKNDACELRFNDGAIYDPASDSWDTITGSERIAARVHHGGVWTGKRLVVWGGHPNIDPNGTYLPDPLGDGGIYNPSARTWLKIESNSPNAPQARAFATTIWTGETGNPESSSKMLVWGGCKQEVGDACASLFTDGGLFDPETRKWSKLQTKGISPIARHNHSVLYVEQQSRLYVFGGIDGNGNVLNDGQILDLKTMTWMPMALTPMGRFKHRAVWAGDRMLIFGGKQFNGATRSYELSTTVNAFVPSADPLQRGRWITYQTEELTPLLTFEHTAIWTGDSLLVWGGQIFDRGFTNSGSRFFPGIDSIP
jgi:N-acetylneuraminic acid mutarotase